MSNSIKRYNLYKERFFLRLILVFLVCFLFPNTSYAEDPITDTSVSAIVNSFKYVRGLRKKDGLTKLGIVYNPKQPQSKIEAEKFIALLKGKEKDARNNTIVPTYISVENIEKIEGMDAIYMTRGLSNYFVSIAQQSQSNHVFSISSDVECAKSECCIVSINTKSGVEILINEKTMRKGGFDVDAAFRYMAVRI